MNVFIIDHHRLSCRVVNHPDGGIAYDCREETPERHHSNPMAEETTDTCPWDCPDDYCSVRR